MDDVWYKLASSPVYTANWNIQCRKSLEKAKSNRWIFISIRGAIYYLQSSGQQADARALRAFIRRRSHPRLPQILSAEARNLSPGPNVFYTSVTTRTTFMRPPLVDTHSPLFPFFRGDAIPCKFVRSTDVSLYGLEFIFHARTQ